jgi:hypothetical protein
VTDETYWGSPALTRDMEGCDALVIHFMIPAFMKGVANAPEGILICWAGWGADYMDLIAPYLGDLLLPETRRLVARLEDRRNRLYRKAASLVGKFVRHPLHLIPYLRKKLRGAGERPEISIHDIAHRIDLISVCPEEMSLIRRALPGFPGEFHQIFSYSAEETFSAGPDRMDGPDLLIGNSATPTNNHLEIFDLLAQVELGNRRLITPLSYGDAGYGDAIERIGRARFGPRFVAIRDYRPLDGYLKTIGSCGVVLMNHVRQQGGTTIATALYKGARVYMRDANPAAGFYRKLGVELASIQELPVASHDPFAPLPVDRRAAHRRIIGDHWSHESAVASARGLAVHAARKRGRSG